LGGAAFGALFESEACVILNRAHSCPPAKSVYDSAPESCSFSCQDTVTLLSFHPGLKSKVRKELLQRAFALPLPLANLSFAFSQYLFVLYARLGANSQSAVPLPFEPSAKGSRIFPVPKTSPALVVTVKL